MYSLEGFDEESTEGTSLDTSREVHKNRRDRMVQSYPVLCQVELTHY